MYMYWGVGGGGVGGVSFFVLGGWAGSVFLCWGGGRRIRWRRANQFNACMYAVIVVALIYDCPVAILAQALWLYTPLRMWA